MERVAIISVDGHVKPSRTEGREYIERKYLEAYDEWSAWMDSLGEIERSGAVHPNLPLDAQWDSDRRVADMESQCVVAEVLFPNGITFQGLTGEAGRWSDPVLQSAGRAAYNRWLADFCSRVPGRRAGQAVVSFDDVDRAVRDIHWAKEHGLGGVHMPPLGTDGPFFFDPNLDPIWKACEETGLPVSQHGGTGTPNYQPDGYAALMTRSYEHSFYSGRSLWQMILGGVFDRFPGLKVAWVETGTFWIPSALNHFDRRERLTSDDWSEWARLQKLRRSFEHLPSEYWYSNCRVGVSPFRETLADPLYGTGALGEFGGSEGDFRLTADTVMVGVDYPHFEGIFPSTLDQVRKYLALPTTTHADARKVLFENAADHYGLDLAGMQPDIERVGFDLGECLATRNAG